MLFRFRDLALLGMTSLLLGCVSPIDPAKLSFRTYFGGIVSSSVEVDYNTDGTTSILKRPLVATPGHYLVRARTDSGTVVDAPVGEMGDFSLEFLESSVTGGLVPTEFDSGTHYIPITFELYYKADSGVSEKVATLVPAHLVASQSSSAFILSQQELVAGIYKSEYTLNGTTHMPGLGIYTRNRVISVSKSTGQKSLSPVSYDDYKGTDSVIWMTVQPDMVY